MTDEIIEASYDVNGDAVVGGEKYRRVNVSHYEGRIKYQYYKWEKIKWRVLQNDGETLFVMADIGLDSKI